MNYHHFTIEERCCLREYYLKGKSYREIAKLLGRNVSSVSRELKYGENLFHINLLQSYGVEMLHPNKVTYEQYLDKYIDIILKNVKGAKTLATDYYPIAEVNGVNIIKEKYLFDLILIALKSKKLREHGHDIKTGFCIQTFVDRGLKLRPLSSVRDVSFQTYTTAAFGAEHFEYFLYTWDGDGLVVDRDKQKNYSPYYFWAKEVNKEMQRLAPYVLKYKWNNAKLFKGEISSTNFEDIKNPIKQYEVNAFENISLKNTADLLVSEFVCNDKKAYMMVNFSEPSCNQDCNISVKFNNAKKLSVFINGKIKHIKSNELNEIIKSGKAIFVMFD